MSRKIVLLILCLLTSLVFASDNIINTQTQNTISQNTIINTSHMGTSKDWELSDAEWIQYLKLMQGPSGHYYSNLSPPEVLGINADSPKDLRHYSEIAAKLEHDKLERELRFNSAFHEAATRLYLTEPIIKEFDFTPFTPIPKN